MNFQINDTVRRTAARWQELSVVAVNSDGTVTVATRNPMDEWQQWTVDPSELVHD